MITTSPSFLKDCGIYELIGETPRNLFALSPSPYSGAVAPSQAPMVPVPHPDRTTAPTVIFPTAPIALEAPMAKKKSIAVSNASNSQDLTTCQNLDDLRQALNDLEGIDLKKLATNLVFADGNPKARVMLIGEAPGADEDRQGLPFVGLSGQLLNRILKSIGLDRTSVYITNIIPWRPPGNRPPTTQEIALCLPFVKRHIELVRPEFLILVGGVSTKAVLDKADGIMKMRGQWMEYSSPGLPAPIRAMAIYHPAFLLRSPAQKETAWRDMITLKKALGSV